MSAQPSLDDLFPTIPFNPKASASQVPWLIDGLWQLGKFNALLGYEKAGKSRFLRWALLHLLLGRPLFDVMAVTQPKKVLWLAGEEQPDDIMAGLLRQAAFMGEAPRLLKIEEQLHFKVAAGMRLEQDRFRIWLGGLLEQGKYDALIIDPLRRLHGANENSNSDMAIILNEMRRWSSVLKVSTVLVHHTPKMHEDADMTRISSWARGASDLATIIDAAVFMERTNSHTILRRMGRYAPRPDIYLLDGNEDQFVFKPKEPIK